MVAEIAGPTDTPVYRGTVSDLIDRAEQICSSRTAYKQFDPQGGVLAEISFGGLKDATTRLAASLSQSFKKGDCVALWGNNSIAWNICELALLRLGVVVVTLDPGLKPHDLRHMLSNCGAVGLLMDRVYRGAGLEATLAAVRGDLPRLQHVGFIDEWRTRAEHAAPVLDATVGPDDPALIVFTSGTTGNPKGVVLTHAGLVGNAAASLRATALSEGAVILNTLPAYTVGGAATINFGALSQQSPQMLMDHFNAGLVIDLVQREKIGWMPLVPAMLLPIAQHESLSATDVSSLEAIWMGGTVITPDHVKLAREKLGVEVITMYGQTEAGGLHTMNAPKSSPEAITQSVGKPIAHGAIRIADLQTGETVAIGVVGEIREKSPYMTRDYFGNPAATADLFDDQGYLKTGDLGAVDADGNLRITGRLKEMIIRGGKNIYPREVEDLLCSFPSVAEAAVVGVPHPKWGEEVAVAVRAMDGQTIDVDAAKKFLSERISAYKVPILWRVVDDFPRGAQAKIRKVDVVKLFSGH